MKHIIVLSFCLIWLGCLGISYVEWKRIDLVTLESSGSLLFIEKYANYMIGQNVVVIREDNKKEMRKIIGLFNNAVNFPVVEISGNPLTNGPSEVISLGRIVGQKIFLIPWIGYLWIVMKNPFIFLGSGLGFLLVVILPEIWSLRKMFNQSKSN